MSPAIFHNFSRRVLLAAAVCAALVCANHAGLGATATNRPATKVPTDRYLLIVDMSSSMERSAENTRRVVGQLMTSGIVGQARAGDTIGIWTFNEVLQTGSFPLQRWTPQTRERIATAAVEFLGRHRYEKRSRFETVIEPLTSVVKESERITVLIITDGSERISGTPFDQEINESYRLNYDMQRQQRMPFITVLRARKGEFIGWRVNAPPFRPELPPFPVEPPAVVETKPEPQPTTAASTSPAPPLIVLGEPPPLSSTPTNTPTTELTQPPAIQTPVATNALSQPKPDAQAAPPAESTKATVDTETSGKPVEPPAPDLQPPTPPPVIAPTTPATDATPPKADPPTESKPAESSASSTAPATSGPEPSAPASTAQTAVATPTESLFNRTNLLLAGTVLLMAGCGFIYVLMRRAARPSERVSLITRSMDRDQK